MTSKSKTASKASNASMPTSTKVKGQTMKAMYRSSEITSRTNGNLWVVFESGKPTSGLVFSMVYTRDEVRNAMRKLTGTSISNIRSQRVRNYRKIS